MERFTELRRSDIKDVFLTLGECCELGNVAQAWCSRLHERLCQLLHTKLTVVMDCEIPTADGRQGPAPSDMIMLFGELAETARENVQHFMATESIIEDPFVKPWQRLRIDLGVRARHQLVPDAVWYSSRVYTMYFRANGVDHRLFARCPGADNSVFIIEQWRSTGDPVYTSREIQTMELFIHELAHFIRSGKLKLPRETEGTNLTPRMRDVLRLVGQGHAEKEIAAQLQLSPHTVHDYVKDLHSILGVETRGELVARACCLNRADVLTPPFRGIEAPCEKKNI